MRDDLSRIIERVPHERQARRAGKPGDGERTLNLPSIGDALPRSGGPTSRAFGRFILRLLRWRVTGSIPNVPKLVVIVAPHTSNWDFVVGIATKWALGLRVHWLGKAALFRPPLGMIMRALGGHPVDRTASHDVVATLVDEFAKRRQLLVALAPEGTRKKVERWRTGFYHIAHGAGAPILPVALDWPRRTIQFGSPLTATGDVDGDVNLLQRFYSDVRGRHGG